MIMKCVILQKYRFRRVLVSLTMHMCCEKYWKCLILVFLLGRQRKPSIKLDRLHCHSIATALSYYPSTRHNNSATKTELATIEIVSPKIDEFVGIISTITIFISAQTNEAETAGVSSLWYRLFWESEGRFGAGLHQSSHCLENDIHSWEHIWRYWEL